MSFSRLSGFLTTIRGRSLILWGRPFKAQIIVGVFLLKQLRMLEVFPPSGSRRRRPESRSCATLNPPPR